MPDDTDFSQLLIYVSPAEGMTYLPQTQLTVVYTDSAGNEQQRQFTVSTSSTSTPRDGLNGFISLQNLDVASIERITYNEQTNNDTLYQPTLHIVEGSLNSLANEVNIDRAYPSQIGYFGAQTSEFLPGAPLLVGNDVVVTDQAGTLVNNLSLASGSRVVISSTAPLGGRTFTVTGVDTNDQSVTETLTFGQNDQLLATTHQWKTVASVTVDAGSTTGYVTIGGSTTFSSPEVVTASVNSDNLPVYTVFGRDAAGQSVQYRVEGMSEYVNKPLGTLSEFYGVVFETPGSVYMYRHSEPDDQTDAFTNGFQSMELLGTRDGNGEIVFAGGAQRIVLTPDGDGSMHIFRVTGRDAQGNLVTEELYGANPYDDGGSAITQHAFASVSDIAVSVVGQIYGVSVGTISAESLVADNLSRFGGEVALGDAVATFESASKITFTTTDNLTGRTVTIHGMNAQGQLTSETLSGFDADGGTWVSTISYRSVSTIEVSAGGNGAIKVGYVTQGGAMLDNFTVTGSGTEADPYVGH